MRGIQAKRLRKACYGDQSFRFFEGYEQKGGSLWCIGKRGLYRRMKDVFRKISQGVDLD